jgi:hypothetical protein
VSGVQCYRMDEAANYVALLMIALRDTKSAASLRWLPYSFLEDGWEKNFCFCEGLDSFAPDPERFPVPRSTGLRCFTPIRSLDSHLPSFVQCT